MESEELIELMGKVEEKGIPWDKVEAEITIIKKLKKVLEEDQK